MRSEFAYLPASRANRGIADAVLDDPAGSLDFRMPAMHGVVSIARRHGQIFRVRGNLRLRSKTAARVGGVVMGSKLYPSFEIACAAVW